MKRTRIFTALLLFFALFPARSQDGEASVSSSIEPDGRGKIIVEARGKLPEVPTFFTAMANTKVTVHLDTIEQESRLTITKIQGDSQTISLGLSGSGEVTTVEGDGQILSWAVRRGKDGRFLDLKIAKEAKVIKPLIKIRTSDLKLPGTIALTQITPGEAVGFSSLITVNYAAGVKGAAVDAKGFLPAKSENQFQTTTGGSLKLNVTRSGSVTGPVEFSKTKLTGEIAADGKSATFQLTGTAQVSEENATLTALVGNAAVSSFPAENGGWGLQLDDVGNYELYFPEPGKFEVSLEFVAAVSQKNEWKELAFTVASGAVAPLLLSGIEKESEFGGNSSVMPRNTDGGGAVTGFIPANGNVGLAWKASRKVGDGKLFFSTVGKIDTSVGAGLMRQTHQLDYKVLQGELESLTVALDGPGEVLNVAGSNVLSWKVTGEGEERSLEVSLSQPITESAQLTIRTQTPLSAFPVRVAGLRATPIGPFVIPDLSGFIIREASGWIPLLFRV